MMTKSKERGRSRKLTLKKPDEGHVFPVDFMNLHAFEESYRYPHMSFRVLLHLVVDEEEIKGQI